ncbi:MAG TPA: hypothetical protein VF960_07855 [Chloroflexota bacterium]
MMWVIIGMVIGLGLAYLVSASRSGKMRIRWYQWLLGVIAVGFLLLAVQNYFALLDELQPKMAGFALIAFGLPGVICAVLAGALPLVFRGKGKASDAVSSVETA